MSDELDELTDAAPPAAPAEVPVPGWVIPVLTLTAVAILPWTLWLTFALPGRYVTENYDVAWVGFDIGLFAAVSATAWSAVKRSQWLVPLATATGTMLLCDAWFDVVTSSRSEERLVAVLSALLAELPLAAVCAFVVWDAERFLQSTVVRYAATIRRLRGRP